MFLLNVPEQYCWIANISYYILFANIDYAPLMFNGSARTNYLFPKAWGGWIANHRLSWSGSYIYL